jgi:hypothetical protein
MEPQSATLATARAVQHANDLAAISAACVKAQARYMRSIELALFPERAGTQRCVLDQTDLHGASAQPQAPSLTKRIIHSRV